MERFSGDQNIAAALSALRPTPRPGFTAELDGRAAAGFPARPERGESAFARLATRLGTLRPRRILVPAAGTALAAIAAVTLVVALSESGSDSTSRLIGTGQPETGATTQHLSELTRPVPSQSGSSASGSSGAAGAAGGPAGHTSEAGAKSSPPVIAGPNDSAGIQYEAEAPAVKVPSGPYAAQAHHREVERSAEMVLGAEPDQVGAASAKVFDAVHAYDGIVLRSSIRGGRAAGASFDLLIPSAKLSDALAAFSAIAEVRSRHEASADVTARTIGLDERLQDARASVESLLKELAASETEAERATAEIDLRSARRHAAALRAHQADLQRHTSLSRVSLRIESVAGAGSAGGGWGAGDALGAAGHILAIAAGVTIVGLAILAPLALIALLAWFANRARVRRSRERALG